MNVGNKLKAIKNVATSKAGLQLLKGRKHSPHILFAAGVVGVVATSVMASRATLKLEDTINENEYRTTQINGKHEELRLDDVELYSANRHKKDLAACKLNFTRDLVRLYGPSVALGVVSVAALTGSHVILTKRNTAVMAAYAALSKTMEEYRERVTAEVGADKERELRFGSESREVAVDNPDGTTSVETITTVLPGASKYAKFFSRESSQSYEDMPEKNFLFLKCVQTYMNDVLQMKGFVLLNDVYDALGLERTSDGCVVGWVKNNKRNPNANGMIDFGIFENPDRFHDFVTGRDGAILLDFNVDGLVFDLI